MVSWHEVKKGLINNHTLNMSIVLSFCFDINTFEQEELRRGNDLFGLYFQVTVHYYRTSGQELKQESEAETREEHGLLACACSCLPSVVIQPRTTCLGNGVTHGGQALLLLMNNQNNTPQTISRANLD